MICGWTYVWHPKPPHWEHLVVFQDLPLLISYPLEFSLTAPIGFCCSHLFAKCSCLRDKLPHQKKKAQTKSSVLKGATSLCADMQTLQNFHVSFYPAQAGTAHTLAISLNASDVSRFVSDGHWHGTVSCFLRRSNGKSSQQGSYPLHYILSPGRGMTIAGMAQGHLWLMFCHILERNGSV